MVETERDKLGTNSWTRAKTETNGGSGPEPYATPDMKDR
jgi:hypothetical protein